MSDELASLKAENERLRAEVDLGNDIINGAGDVLTAAGFEVERLDDMLRKLVADRDQLATQLRACERDAQRYEYLRSMADRVSVSWIDHDGTQGAFDRAQLDKLVDTASTPTPGKE